MAQAERIEVRVREHRTRLGWSQDALAARAGLSRAGVSAIETGRLVPSTAAALALARALGSRVEDLFRLPGTPDAEPAWAWPAGAQDGRFWRAEVGGRTLLYPAEPTALGLIPHDGRVSSGADSDPRPADPSRTLVIAGCDPAVGLLAGPLAAAGIRLIALTRSSRAALDLLARGLVHASGLHLARAGVPGGNAEAARQVLGPGPGHRLLRLARWEEGVAFAPTAGLGSFRDVLRPGLRWVGREPGSGARQCLDELLGDRRPPRRIAGDHRGVAEAIRSGWADAGVCLRLVSAEAGLGFLGVRQEDYDLCFPETFADDPRLRALVDAARSPGYRRRLGELPGYDAVATGEVQRVD